MATNTRRSRQMVDSYKAGEWDKVYSVLFILAIVLLRVLVKRVFLPKTHVPPPPEQLILFKPDQKNSAFTKMPKNEDG